MFKQEYESNSRKDNLRYIFLELTKTCNLKCKHCGSYCSPEHSAELTTGQWINFINYIASNFPKEQIMFCITGGEPMIRSDFYEIVNQIHNHGFSWGLTTNGTLITKEDVSKLKRAGMKTISISVDGLEETHDSFRNSPGSFAKAVNAYKLLTAYKFFECVQITTVVNKYNITELEDMYKFFDNMGLKEWRIASVDPIGRANDNSDMLLSSDDYETLFDFISNKRHMGWMKVQYACSHFVPERFEYDLRNMRYKCAAGIHVASVLSNGDIFSCIDIERRPELIQGNILKDDFCEKWEQGFKKFIGKNRVMTSKKCSACKNSSVCEGDSAHTWDYDKNEPKICLFEMMKQKRFNSLNLCGNCKKQLFDNAEYCEFCGTKRGSGQYNIFDFNIHDMQMLYGPPPELCIYICNDCKRTWEHSVMGTSETKNCPYCSSTNITYQRKKLF